MSMQRREIPQKQKSFCRQMHKHTNGKGQREECCRMLVSGTIEVVRRIVAARCDRHANGATTLRGVCLKRGAAAQVMESCNQPALLID